MVQVLDDLNLVLTCRLKCIKFPFLVGRRDPRRYELASNLPALIYEEPDRVRRPSSYQTENGLTSDITNRLDTLINLMSSSAQANTTKSTDTP